MWGPGFCQPSTCHNHTSSGSHSENGVPPSSMKAPEGSYFSADSPSSGVIMTDPPGHHVPINLLLPRRRTSPQSPFPAHVDEGTWHCPGRAPSGGHSLSFQLYIAWSYLRCPPGKGPEASRLSTEPPKTSEKHLPPMFPEAEAMVSRDIAGEHPSG